MQPPNGVLGINRKSTVYRLLQPGLLLPDGYLWQTEKVASVYLNCVSGVRFYTLFIGRECWNFRSRERKFHGTKVPFTVAVGSLLLVLCVRVCEFVSSATFKVCQGVSELRLLKIIFRTRQVLHSPHQNSFRTRTA